MRMVVLSKVAKIDRRNIAPENIAAGTQYLGLEHIQSEGGCNPIEVSAGELGSNKFAFTPDHVLFGKLRPYLKKTTLVDFNGICSTDIIPILPDPEQIDKRYLYYFLLSEDTVRKAVERCSGANLPRLSPTELAKFEIRLPPLSEQRRIAARLDAADRLRALDRALVGKYEEMKRSLFLEMISSEKGKTEGWPVRTVEELAADGKGAMRTGPFGSDLLHSEFVDSGVLVLGIDNAVNNDFKWDRLRYITEEKYETLKRYTVHPGDVLVTIMGTVGRTAIVPDDIPVAINSKHLAAISLNHSKCLPEVLWANLLYDPGIKQQILQQAKGAVMDGLNLTIIKGLKLIVPPRPVQVNFKDRLRDVTSQLTFTWNSLAHSEMMASNFLGQQFTA